MTPLIIVATEGLLPPCLCGGCAGVEREGRMARIICTECGISSLWKTTIDNAARDWKLMLVRR